MDSMIENISNLNPKVTEIYILDDFNINLLSSGNYILNGKRKATSQGPVYILIHRYTDLFQIFWLNQSTSCPNRVT